MVHYRFWVYIPPRCMASWWKTSAYVHISLCGLIFYSTDVSNQMWKSSLDHTQDIMDRLTGISLSPDPQGTTTRNENPSNRTVDWLVLHGRHVVWKRGGQAVTHNQDPVPKWTVLALTRDTSFGCCIPQQVDWSMQQKMVLSRRYTISPR